MYVFFWDSLADVVIVGRVEFQELFLFYEVKPLTFKEDLMWLNKKNGAGKCLQCADAPSLDVQLQHCLRRKEEDKLIFLASRWSRWCYFWVFSFCAYVVIGFSLLNQPRPFSFIIQNVRKIYFHLLPPSTTYYIAVYPILRTISKNSMPSPAKRAISWRHSFFSQT